MPIFLSSLGSDGIQLMLACRHLWTELKQMHHCGMSTTNQRPQGGTAAAAPPPFRPSDPALCPSHPILV